MSLNKSASEGDLTGLAQSRQQAMTFWIPKSPSFSSSTASTNGCASGPQALDGAAGKMQYVKLQQRNSDSGPQYKGSVQDVDVGGGADTDTANSSLPSKGSSFHPNSCNPCLFWFKGSCDKGFTCKYCHLLHEGQKSKRIRPSKRTRMLRAGSGQGEPAAAQLGA